MDYAIGTNVAAQIQTADAKNKVQQQQSWQGNVQEEIKALKDELAKIKAAGAPKIAPTPQDGYAKMALIGADTGAVVNTVLNSGATEAINGAVAGAGMANLTNAWHTHKVNEQTGKQDDDSTKSVLKTAKNGGIVGALFLPTILAIMAPKGTIKNVKTIGNKIAIAGFALGAAALGGLSAAYTWVGYKSLFCTGSSELNKSKEKKEQKIATEV